MSPWLACITGGKGTLPLESGYTITPDDYSAPVPHYIDSDESDSDEMLPLGAFWPVPAEEEWTMVERAHGIRRSAKDIDSDRLYNSGISWIIQECAVSSWAILTGMKTGMI